MTLPKAQLLEGSQNTAGLEPLLELAETALRTWQPHWSRFVSAPLREELIQRSASLS